MNERWFAVVAAIALVALVAGAVAAAGGDGAGDGELDWAPEVPAVHAEAEPDGDGVAAVGDREFDTVQAAVDAAEPGDTVVLEGVFEEHVVVETPGVTIEATEADAAVVDGGGEGTVVTVDAEDVTLEGVWIRDSGDERSEEDAGVLVNGTAATITDVRLTEINYGVWVDGVEDVTIEETIVAGRADSHSATQIGNGVHLHDADGAELRDNYITTVRDGIYYSYADGVVAEDNVIWDVRYGVHYMYSSDNRLERNVAFDNDVGFALMVSQNLTLVENVAVANDGGSGHGILVKDVEQSEVRANAVVDNGNGLYVYNSHGNAVADNLVLENDVGAHVTAGSSGERFVGNSFMHNDQQAFADSSAHASWNDSDGGNYWSDDRAVDVDGDGTSEIRHQPAGAVEGLVNDRPQAAVFADSPAFDAVRLAESSFPVVESAGVVDHRPLAEPPHEDWRDYYEHHDH